MKLRIIYSIIICQLAGIIGSIFTSSAIPSWYAALSKPTFNPPNWLFGPVWITLYLLMGIALYLVWEKKGNLAWFWIQLGLNTLWSILFFGLKSPWLAFVEIVLLWVAILLTIITFYRQDKTAAYLLIPYMLWVSFAAALNLAIALLN